MKKVVITGATGVIGMALINKCIEENCQVTVLVNPNSRRIARLEKIPNINIIPCGIDEYSKVDCTTKYGIDGCDVFYHLAWGGTFGEARNDMELQEMNVIYALDAVGLANRLGAECFVGVGSQAEYGRVEGVLTANTPTNPENGYGIAKLAAGKRTRELCSELNIRHIWTRVLSIYGPYDGDSTMVTATVKRLLKGECPALTKGEQLWDYLYSKDAAEALYLLGINGANGKVYPIGSGVARPLREYVEIIRDTINPELPLGFGEVPYSDKQVMHLCADIAELTSDTGFTSKYSFEEGIKETIAYIAENID